MAHQKKIQDYNAWYSFLRHYVDLALKLSYRTVRYVGYDKIPQDGAVIYAPNHTNALMDALVILAMDRKPKVFVARADIFRKPILAKIFTFMRIMPIMRLRDGVDEVKKNYETIERAVDVLRDKVPFCIFPEGQHQAKYSSLPLSKGIFRIAFQAQELMPDMPLYIVPVGMRYGNFFRFRSTVRVQVGRPINVGEFIAEHSEMTQPEQINAMRELLVERIREAIFYIPDDEFYEATVEIAAAVSRRQTVALRREKQTSRLRGMNAYFEANNRTVARIARIREEDPERAAALLRHGNEAARLRKEAIISLSSVAVRFPVLSRMLKVLLLLVTLPYTLAVSLLALPVALVSRTLCSKFKDIAFHNSARYLVHLVLWPLLLILYAVVTYIVLPWQWALPVTLALVPAPIVAQETWRLLRLVVSDTRLMRHKQLRHHYRRIRHLFFEKA